MSKPLVYLAGPITGTSYGECTDWRQYVQEQLAQNWNVAGMSPMRHKDYLLRETSMGDTYEDQVMSSQRGIFARDFWDADRCDALFVNLLGADRVSIGTVMEISWAWSARNPCVLVMENEGNPHEHAMLREACPFRVDTIDEGIQVIGTLFSQSDH